MAYYPEKQWVQIGGYSMIGYMMIGVSAAGGGRMHWFSDAIAGTLMGYAIGATVGRYFRTAYLGQTDSEHLSRLSLAPLITPGASGFRTDFRF